MQPPSVCPSLADIPESKLVEQLMNNTRWRNKIVVFHGIPPGVVHHLAVPMRGLPREPRGDIDILLSAPKSPEHTIAIQVKRIKVDKTAFEENGRPNKLNDFTKGIRQANILADIGFSQVYYFVFVMVDSRFHNRGRVTYDGLTRRLNTIIDQAVSLERLLPRIGLVHFEFVQPMDYEPLDIGIFGGHLKRIAERVPQPPQVTAWVKQAIVKGHA